MKRKSLSVVLALCLALTLIHVPVFAEENTLPFLDVAEGSWFYDAVAFACSKELMSGTSATTFDPLGYLTRATVATVLYRMDGMPFVVEEERFSDVPTGAWYSKAICWAHQNGIVSGYDSGAFGTNDSISREQFATMVYQYASYLGFDSNANTSLSMYSDAEKISSWAHDAMSWAVANSVITGTSATTLDPGGIPNRAQCAMILTRFMQKFVTDDSTEPDNVFERLTDEVFILTSGAGGWSTEVAIKNDGSFIGYYHDSEMGIIGEDYPGGSYYESRFNGRFVLNEKIDEKTYVLKIVELNVNGTIGEEKIVNGVRIITTEVFGLTYDDELLLYLPGTKTAGLPSDYLTWVGIPNIWYEMPEELPFFGLYSEKGNVGFYSAAHEALRA